MSGYRGAGVYVFRTRRPGLLGRLPWWIHLAAMALSAAGLAVQHYSMWFALLALVLSPRHFAYVGESVSVRLRRRDHLQGSMKYNQLPKPWADLEPTWYFLPLPMAPKFILRGIESLLIALLWPVYNHQKNQWNPRRIPLSAAKRQRGQRDFARWSFNMRPAHAIGWAGLIGFIAVNQGWV